jgi:hypothetical protein
MSDLSTTFFHDRGEKTLLAHRWGALALDRCGSHVGFFGYVLVGGGGRRVKVGWEAGYCLLG